MQARNKQSSGCGQIRPAAVTANGGSAAARPPPPCNVLPVYISLLRRTSFRPHALGVEANFWTFDEEKRSRSASDQFARYSPLPRLPYVIGDHLARARGFPGVSAANANLTERSRVPPVRLLMPQARDIGPTSYKRTSIHALTLE